MDKRVTTKECVYEAHQIALNLYLQNKKHKLSSNTDFITTILYYTILI